ncbi:MAG: metallophosphoesterase [Rubrobacter sp.]|nr:metallophosphoesterase [Rubrobacter sp.]
MTMCITADTHFGHDAIRRYCDRPFVTASEMDEEIVRRWNMVLGGEDAVIHLGDFALVGVGRIEELLAELDGHKILVLGNHDRSAKRMRELGFDEVYKEYEISGIRCVHYPEHARAGEVTFAGHVHNAWDEMHRADGARIVNVGVDVHDFQLQTLDELLGDGIISG